MRAGLLWFNTNLLALAIAVAAMTGCASGKSPTTSRKKAIATLRLYLTTPPNAGYETDTVTIVGSPVVIRKEPFLFESSVERAMAVEVTGRGYQLEVQFDSHGTMVLDSITAENRGRHIAVLSQFGRSAKDKKNRQVWLGCPQIRQRITDGVFIFTPDCSFEEAQLIADGLNTIAAKNQ
jgi:preprotein translocase subunit SecD